MKKITLLAVAFLLIASLSVCPAQAEMAASVATLDTAIKAALANQQAFERLFAITVADQNSSTATYVNKLIAIVSDSSYTTASTYVTLMSAADALATSLWGAAAASKTAFQALYNTTIVDPANTSASYVGILFGIVADSSYNSGTYMSLMTGAYDLHTALTGSVSYKNDFYTVYGQTVATPFSSGYRSQLFGVVSVTGYAQAAYLANLGEAASLHDALDGGYRDEFAAIYGISAGSQNPVSNSAYRTKLFEIVGDPAYVGAASQTAFLGTLIVKDSLHTALTADATAQTALATVYGVAVSSQTRGTASYESVLTEIVNISGYSQAAFITYLKDASALHAALAAGSYKDEFESVYAITQANQDPVANTTYRTQLFSIVATGGYSQAAYIADLSGSVSLHTALASYRSNFATIYGITTGNQVLTNSTYKTQLSSIISESGYVEATKVALINAAASLHAALGGGYRDEFASIYGIAEADQNPVSNNAYKVKLFEIVATSGYNESAFISGMDIITNLHNALASHRAEFEAIYGISQADQVAQTGPYLDIIGGVTVMTGYSQAAYIADLAEASALHTALGGGYRDEFEALYGIVQADQDPAAYSTYRTKLFEIVGDPTYVGSASQTTFLADLAATVSLHNALASYRTDVATIYGITVPNQVLSNATYKQLLSDIVAGTVYVQADYITALINAANLHSALGTGGYRDEFALVYGIAEADQNPVSNVSYRSKLFGIVGTLGYSQSTFLSGLSVTNNLHDALALCRDDFNTMYGIATADQVMTNTSYTDILWQIVTLSGYSQSAYVSNLQAAADLHATLIGGAGFTTNFEAIYGSGMSPENPATNASYRTKLFEIVGTTGYTETDFIYDMNACVNLHNALASHRSDITDIYGIALADQALNKSAYKQLLSDIVFYSSYDQTAYVTALNDALLLHAALDAGTLRDQFALIYGIPTASQNPVSSTAYRTKLFDIVGWSGYDQATFLTSLDATSKLDDALEAGSLRPAFEAMYGIAQADQDPSSNSTYQQLLNDIVFTPGYDQSDYLTILPLAYALHTDIGADGLKDEFETIFGVPQADQDPQSNLTYRTYIFGIAGDPAYSSASFLSVLPKAASLHTALASGLRDDFETVYGVAQASQVTTNLTYRQWLFDIAGDPAFSQSDFTAALPEVASLHGALELWGAREEFETMFGIAKVSQDPTTSVTYRKALFDVVGDPGYTDSSDETNFLTVLLRAASLDAALSADSSLQDAFEVMWGIAPASQDPVTNLAYRKAIFDIAGDPSFNQAAFLAALPDAAELHLRLDGYRYSFEDLYSTHIAPSNQYTTNGTYKGQLFGIVGDQTTFHNNGGVDGVIDYLDNFNIIGGRSNPYQDMAYIRSCQYTSSSSSPGYGAINDVKGDPTWVVPAEMGNAILGLMKYYDDVYSGSTYLTAATRAADYLISVQQSDGAWCDQYNYATVVDAAKSASQTAEVMMGLNAVGYDSAHYNAMKKGAQFLIECQKVSNKTGNDDGLICGGKDSSGNWQTWRWASDNSYAYQALRAAEIWAYANGDSSFGEECKAAYEKILKGINDYLYIDTAGTDYGVWLKVIDASGNLPSSETSREWINYAPAMLDLPATGAGSAIVGQWIHDNFQLASGAVVWDDSAYSTRMSPGFALQAMLVWYDLGQYEYIHDAFDWLQGPGFLADSDNDVPDIAEKLVYGDLTHVGYDSTTDSDSDGMADVFETALYGNLSTDMKPSGYYTDSDSDGIPDVIEKLVNGSLSGTSISSTDSDDDGVADAIEMAVYGNLTNSSMVGSGLWDSWRSGYGWIDWIQPDGVQAAAWQRFIDTSFYSLAAMLGGYDFNPSGATKTYWATTGYIYREEYFSAAGAWQKTAQYQENSSGVLAYEWFLSGPNGESYREYDSSGKLTYTRFTDLSHMLTGYYSSGNRYRDEYFDSSWSWQHTIQYKDSSSGVYAYEWFLTGDTDGAIYREYDTSGKITYAKFSDNTHMLASYFSGTGNLYRKEYFDSSWAWRKTVEYQDASGEKIAYEWFLSGPNSESYREYDSSGKLTYTRFTDLSHMLTGYRSSGNRYRDEYFDSSWSWTHTIQYQDSSSLVYQYEWFLSGPGGAVYREYNTSGKLTYTKFSDGSHMVTSYFSATGNRYRDEYFDSSWTWQKTIEYWDNASAIMHFKWVIEGGVTKTYEYDAAGNLVSISGATELLTRIAIESGLKGPGVSSGYTLTSSMASDPKTGELVR